MVNFHLLLYVAALASAAAGFAIDPRAVGDGCSFYVLPNCQTSRDAYFERLPVKSNADLQITSFHCTRPAQACAQKASGTDPCRGCADIAANVCHTKAAAVCFL
ncbi:unnamed protein product [Parajaminaea phylloscopi]